MAAYPLAILGESIEFATGSRSSDEFGKGESREVFESLVSDPAEFTFSRSLGDL